MMEPERKAEESHVVDWPLLRFLAHHQAVQRRAPDHPSTLVLARYQPPVMT